MIASVVAQPELMGMSGGGAFIVTDDAVASAAVPALLSSLNVQPLTVVHPVACAAACSPGVLQWLCSVH